MNQHRFTFPLLCNGRWIAVVLMSIVLVGMLITDHRPLHAGPPAQENVNPHSGDAVNADGFDEDGWSLNLGYPGISGTIRGMKVIDGDLYLWGDLRRVGGIAVKQMAKLSGQTGVWSNVDIKQSMNLYDMLVSGTQLYLAGRIEINGAVYGVALYDGVNVTPLGGTFNGPVYAIAWHQGQLYATGAFTQIAGSNINRIARWNGTQWEALGSGLLGFEGIPEGRTLISTGDTLYVGGRFNVAGGVAVKNLVARQDNQWRHVFDVEGEVLSMAWDGASLYVGGALYANIGGHTQRGIIRIQDNQPYPVGNGLSAGATVHAILPAPGGIYVAGREFYHGVNADGSHTPLTNVAFFDGARWHPVGQNFGGQGYHSTAMIHWLGLWQGQVAAVGDMVRLGTKSFQGVAMWDGAEWNRPPNNPGTGVGVNGAVRDIFIYGDNLYLAGAFTLAGNLDLPGLARWDGLNWYPIADGTLGGLQSARWIVVNATGIYIGGPHRLDDGIDMWNVAHWDGASWRLIGDHINGRLTRVYTDGQAIYISGIFRPFGPDEIYGAARWDGAQWFFYRNVRQSGWVYDIAAINGTVYGCGPALLPEDQMIYALAQWVGDHWQSFLPDTVWPNCRFTVHGDSLYLHATLIKQHPETNLEVILRIIGSQWEVVPTPPELLVSSVAQSPHGDLYSFSHELLPSQFQEPGGNPPLAKLHWRPANEDLFFPVPKSNFSIPEGFIGVYKDMLVLGGIEGSMPPPAFYFNTWRPPAADVATSLSAPGAVQVGQTLSVTATVSLSAGQSAPYIRADITGDDPTVMIQNGTLAQCYSDATNQGTLQCAWRSLRDGEATHAQFTMTPVYVGKLHVNLESWWSGRDTNRANDRATLAVDVYDTLTARPQGGNFFFWFKSGSRLDLRIPAAAVSAPIELYLSQESAPSPGGGLATVHPTFRISADSLRSVQTTVFNSPVAVTLRYTEADLYPVFEETVALYRYDPQRGEWIPSHEECETATPSVVNPEQNQVQASMCRTGTYALIGEAKPLIFLPQILRANR